MTTLAKCSSYYKCEVSTVNIILNWWLLWTTKPKNVKQLLIVHTISLEILSMPGKEVIKLSHVHKYLIYSSYNSMGSTWVYSVAHCTYISKRPSPSCLHWNCCYEVHSKLHTCFLRSDRLIVKLAVVVCLHTHNWLKILSLSCGDIIQRQPTTV